MNLKPEQIEQIKEAYFRVESMRSGIPTWAYELPADVLALYELGEQYQAWHKRFCRDTGQRLYEQKKADTPQEWPGRLCPRLARRSVGYANQKEDMT